MQLPQVSTGGDAIISVFSDRLQTYVSGYYKDGEKSFSSPASSECKKWLFIEESIPLHACLHIARPWPSGKYDMIKNSNLTNNERELTQFLQKIIPTQTRYHLHSSLHPLRHLLQSIYASFKNIRQSYQEKSKQT